MNIQASHSGLMISQSKERLKPLRKEVLAVDSQQARQFEA